MEALRCWVVNSVDLEWSTGGVVIERDRLLGVIEERPYKKNDQSYVEALSHSIDECRTPYGAVIRNSQLSGA